MGRFIGNQMPAMPKNGMQGLHGLDGDGDEAGEQIVQSQQWGDRQYGQSQMIRTNTDDDVPGQYPDSDYD